MLASNKQTRPKCSVVKVCTMKSRVPGTYPKAKFILVDPHLDEIIVMGRTLEYESLSRLEYLRAVPEDYY